MQRNSDQIFNESFLDVRAKLLEVAATLDRIDRSANDGEPLSPHVRAARSRVDDAVRICLSEGPDRAERLQQLFSREFNPQWRSEMKL